MAWTVEGVPVGLAFAEVEHFVEEAFAGAIRFAEGVFAEVEHFVEEAFVTFSQCPRNLQNCWSSSLRVVQAWEL